MQDTKEICPWEILEGVKNSGPLMLSWFGAVRMKRKPLWFEEQRNLVRFHAHQNQFQNYITGPNTVKLPSEEPVPMGPPSTSEGAEKPPEAPQNDTKPPRTRAVSGEPVEQGGGGSAPSHPSAAAGNVPGGSGMAPAGAAALPRPQELYPAGIRQQPMMAPNPAIQPQYMANRPMAGMNTVEQMRQQQQMRRKLKQIRDMNQNQPPHMGVMPPPMYPGSMVGPGMTMPNYRQMQKQQQLQVLQQHHQMQQRRMHMLRLQQQQQQQQQHMQQQMMSQQYGYQTQPSAPGMHAMRPMQANPPMQMQQVMQQTRQYPGVAHSAMMGPPTAMRQPGMQYPPQQAPGMNQVMPRPGGMF